MGKRGMKPGSHYDRVPTDGLRALMEFCQEWAPEDVAAWEQDVRRTLSMATFKKYRSKVLVEAKPLLNGGTFWNDASGQKESYHAGDYVVKEPSGKQRIVGQEQFQREYEEVE